MADDMLDLAHLQRKLANAKTYMDSKIQLASFMIETDQKFVDDCRASIERIIAEREVEMNAHRDQLAVYTQKRANLDKFDQIGAMRLVQVEFVREANQAFDDVFAEALDVMIDRAPEPDEPQPEQPEHAGEGGQ